MKKLAAVVLAAGKGTRMKSDLPKVLHQVCGTPMLLYPLGLLTALGAAKTVVVVGHGAKEVEAAVKDKGKARPGGSAKGAKGAKIVLSRQTRQLGTGHALASAVKKLRGFSGDIIILSGDVPLITRETLKALLLVHNRKSNGKRAVLTLVTALVEDPSGYGRVIRNERGAVERVVEDRDLKSGERAINEVNAGIYLADSRFVFDNLKKIGKRNARGEYYLTDLVGMAARAGEKVNALTHFDTDEVMGINNRAELAKAASVMRERINNSLMLSGVTIVDPASTYIDYGVRVARDSVIHPNTCLAGQTVIGGGCTIWESSRVVDSTIGRGTTIKSFSIIESSKIGRGVSIGPFARLRPGSQIGDNARVGNFVEVKKTRLGAGSKASHLSYLGDSIIGKGVNIGAGTITCNYDGMKKHTTIIGDGAFIGSDTQLIAPVTIGKNAYIGSGSTITKDVPPGTLAVARAEQKIFKGRAGLPARAEKKKPAKKKR